MDIISRFMALLLLLILSPLLLLISLILFVFQGCPIIFYRKRVGYNFKIFNIYKFRSMEINSGSLLTKDDDNRITFIGRIIRSTKLDEIPQLVNILFGDMRFIGPRP